MALTFLLIKKIDTENLFVTQRKSSMENIEILLNAQSETHPCFSPSAVSSCARVHLPVVRECNISCNYCNREYDCVNESRPGVASRIISPEEALEKVKEAISCYPQLTTAAVAGPGDALADAHSTFKTLNLIHEEFPLLNLCFSTNGLNLLDNIDEITDCGITHISVTVNSLDEELSSRIYSFIKLNGKVLKGKEAGRILIERQLEGIGKLIERRMPVKINSVVIPGINDAHLPFLAQRMKKEGVNLINFIPMVKVKGAKFEKSAELSEDFYRQFLQRIPAGIPLMKHCRMCRADAEGFIIDNIRDSDIRAVKKSGAFLPIGQEVGGKLFLLAVAGKREGFVNEHFGRAEKFFIYESDGSNFRLIEKRSVEKFCEGKDNCADRRKDIERIASILSDCKVLLCSGAGSIVTHLLEKNGIRVHIRYGMVGDALTDIKKELFP